MYGQVTVFTKLFTDMEITKFTLHEVVPWLTNRWEGEGYRYLLVSSQGVSVYTVSVDSSQISFKKKNKWINQFFENTSSVPESININKTSREICKKTPDG